MVLEELAVLFALALSTRPNSDVYKTNDTAIIAAKDLLAKLEQLEEQE